MARSGKGPQRGQGYGAAARALECANGARTDAEGARSGAEEARRWAQVACRSAVCSEVSARAARADARVACSMAGSAWRGAQDTAARQGALEERMGEEASARRRLALAVREQRREDRRALVLLACAMTVLWAALLVLPWYAALVVMGAALLALVMAVDGAI